MNKIILSILAIAFYSLGNAQNVTIPDANFKAYLVGNNAINTNGDSEIQVSEANAFTGGINVNNLGISSLTGIQYFTSLTQLYCSNNQLTSLDVSNIITLTYLFCYDNQLTSLNIGNYTSLAGLDCSNNQLTSLDVTNNTHLVILTCANNQISILDTSNLTLLEELVCDNNQIAMLNLVSSAPLTTLHCNNNNLTTLNVSNSTNLSWLNCSYNQLTSLNITGLSHIENLFVNNNYLATLNVSLNSNLAILDASYNQLTYLNVANAYNYDFEVFDARQNLLDCIEVDDVAYSTTNWTNIDNYVYFSTTPCQPCIIGVPDPNFKLYLKNNPLININGDDEIQCAEAHNFTGTININNLNVADMTGIEEFYQLTILRCNNNQIPSINLSNNNDLLYLDIGLNDLTSIDVSNNTDLQTLHVYNNVLTNLDVSSNADLTHLRCESNFINTLDVSNNSLLETLNCSLNNLSSLDVYSNPSLTSLNCRDNQIGILDVKNNIVLNSLQCKNNQIDGLDLTYNTVLTFLNCENNALTGLDVANGNNTNFIYFNALTNSNLTCINVDDATYSSANWTNIDVQSSFSENCSAPKTYVPDDNFEQALIDFGYDTALDNYVFTANINTLTNLNVSNKNIADLTGIQDFISLINLNCSNNQLTSLTNINDLDNLDNLNCNFNQLTSLDVEDNVALSVLACRANALTTLNVFNNTLLEFLSCRDNLLTDLDVSNNPALVRVWCFNNQLTTLNAKNGSNTNIANSNFNATNNPDLTCIEVDDTTWSTTNWTNIDAQSSFSEDCNYLAVADFNLDAAFTIYPNPTKNNFKIESDFAISKINIYDNLGKLLLQFNTQETYDVSSLTDGIYFIQIYSDNHKIQQKLIINSF